MKHILSHYWMIRAWAGLDFIRAKNNRTGMTGVSDNVRTRQNFQARALGDFHDRVLSAARAWGHKFSSEAMHVYMGENRFSLWSYHIILALYSNVASYHLISTRFLITTSFMISIKWPVDYPIYTNFNEPSHLPCPTSNIGLRTTRQCLPPCGG